MTDATMNQVLMDFKRENGHPAMRALLFAVAGVHAISEVPDDKIDDVIAACESGGDYKKPKAKASKADFHDPGFVNGVYAKWNGI
ncbi:hypothetical protein [Tardiphaga sp. 813_E8_N1_3]|uniref:hypothetical protein n=1 Tax=Tardiphaga sp. 813_E8_N1_3 TaxID=3240760 RepID=UPI003F26D24E